MNGRTMQSILRVTKALADPQRIRILMMLGAGELCVCQIVEVLSLAPSTVSKHLSILSGAGLVDLRKRGRWAYYRLPEGASAPFVRPVLDWLNAAVKDDEGIRQDRKKQRAVSACDLEKLCRRQRLRVGAQDVSSAG